MKICFWGNIASALEGRTNGGGELQIALLAKALAKGGHEVVIIDCQTAEDFVTGDGIKILKIDGWNRGIRIIRTFTHRLPQLYRSLKAQKADIYYCRIRDFRHILAFWAARKVNAKFILGLASDLDAMNFAMRLKYDHFVNSSGLWGFFNDLLIEIVYPYLHRNADLVLVQHDGQKNILLKKHIKSLVFPNLLELTDIPSIRASHPKDFIYVGELNKRKGFTNFFEIVNKAPLFSFKVVGQPGEKTGYLYYNKLKSYRNVNLLGRLSHSDTLSQILNSKALISTSPMEGFPNIFIEAWACGIPVLSLYVDPGGVIERERLGEIAYGNCEKLLHAMENFRTTDEFISRAKKYVKHNHAMTEDNIKKINHLFNEVVNNKKSNINDY